MPDPVNREAAPRVDGHWPWPRRCLGCGGAVCTPGRDLCAGCHARLPWLGTACRACAMPLAADGTAAPERLCAPCRSQPPPVHRTVAAFLYAPPLDRWLPRLKFHRDLTAGRLLSQLMLDRLCTAERPNVVLPVPLHRARLRSRGYDQALELARPLARALDLPLQCDLLQRIRATKPQSELDGAARSRNLRGAFAFGATVPPAHVALVDDVMTTGATLRAAAATLRRAGVARVDAWVCARVP